MPCSGFGRPVRQRKREWHNKCEQALLLASMETCCLLLRLAQKSKWWYSIFARQRQF